MENVMKAGPHQWKILEANSKNGNVPVEEALSLVTTQLRRATNARGLSPNDKADNLELIGQLRKVVDANIDEQTDQLRIWFKRMRSHLGLQRLGGYMEPSLQMKLPIVERVLASLPPEEKKYPSDKLDPVRKAEPEAGFFQSPDPEVIKP